MLHYGACANRMDSSVTGQLLQMVMVLAVRLADHCGTASMLSAWITLLAFALLLCTISWFQSTHTTQVKRVCCLAGHLEITQLVFMTIPCGLHAAV